jgi:hypothetical protein
MRVIKEVYMSENLESTEVSPDEMQAFEQESIIETPQTQEEPTKEEVQAMLREYKIKVNGKETIEKIDLNDEARIIKALQLEKLSTQNSQKAAEKEKELAAYNKQLDDFFALLKNDPLSILLNPDLGIDAEHLASKILDMKLEEEILSQKTTLSS